MGIFNTIELFTSMLIYWATWDLYWYMGYMGNVKYVSSTAALFSGALLKSHYTEYGV
jgi:hypothetical protein